MNILIHDDATAELTEAADGYEVSQPGLGEDFFREYKLALERIASDPESLPLLETAPEQWGIRRVLRHRFPFVVVFDGGGQRVRVLAVAHTARQPLYWSLRRRNF